MTTTKHKKHKVDRGPRSTAGVAPPPGKEGVHEPHAPGRPREGAVATDRKQPHPVVRRKG
jgi:hypothetical protein